MRKSINLFEMDDENGSFQALSLIDAAAEKFGRYNLAAGNCGTFALALSNNLRSRGYKPTIALLHRWYEEDDYSNGIDGLVETDPDIYHVVVMMGDKMFDASGETSISDLLSLSIREYKDKNPGFIRDIGIDEEALHTIIEHDTNWSIPVKVFEKAMNDQSDGKE